MEYLPRCNIYVQDVIHTHQWLLWIQSLWVRPLWFCKPVIRHVEWYDRGWCSPQGCSFFRVKIFSTSLQAVTPFTRSFYVQHTRVVIFGKICFKETLSSHQHHPGDLCNLDLMIFLDLCGLRSRLYLGKITKNSLHAGVNLQENVNHLAFVVKIIKRVQLFVVAMECAPIHIMFQKS